MSSLSIERNGSKYKRKRVRGMQLEKGKCSLYRMSGLGIMKIISKMSIGQFWQLASPPNLTNQGKRRYFLLSNIDFSYNMGKNWKSSSMSVQRQVSSYHIQEPGLNEEEPPNHALYIILNERNKSFMTETTSEFKNILTWKKKLYEHLMKNFISYLKNFSNG